jgi:hypothetical protein
LLDDYSVKNVHNVSRGGPTVIWVVVDVEGEVFPTDFEHLNTVNPACGDADFSISFCRHAAEVEVE